MSRHRRRHTRTMTGIRPQSFKVELEGLLLTRQQSFMVILPRYELKRSRAFIYFIFVINKKKKDVLCVLNERTSLGKTRRSTASLSLSVTIGRPMDICSIQT